MKLLSPKQLLWLLGPQTHFEEEEDRADVEYIKTAKHDTFRPLREVLAEIEAKEKRGELRGPIKQTG